MSEADRAFMRRAIALAARGWGQTAPNPMVGAVVVRDGAVVGEGYHTRHGAPHAEVEALRAAGDAARGATVYVSLEPCNHFGKTPPCTRALIEAGVSRVVAAARDPNPAAGGGAEALREAGVQVDLGVDGAAARELNAPFFHAFVSDRPWVTLKLALSLDGAIADATRKPRWLTGEESRREVHRMRAGSDAVAVGLGTVLADDPALTVRRVEPPPRVPPRRVVFDRELRLPPESVLARTARETPTVVVGQGGTEARERALRALGVEVLHAAGPAQALRRLREQLGVRALLVEGGARLAGSLLEQSLVDRLVIFQAPVVLGAGALGAFSFAPPAAEGELRRLPALERRQLGGDLMTVYALNGDVIPNDGA